MDCNAVSVLYVQFDIGPPPFSYLTLQINCRGKSSDPAIIEYGGIGGHRCSEGPVRLVLLKLSLVIGWIRCRVDQIGFARLSIWTAFTSSRLAERAAHFRHAFTILSPLYKYVWAVALSLLTSGYRLSHVILSRILRPFDRTPTEQSLSMLQVGPSRFSRSVSSPSI